MEQVENYPDFAVVWSFFHKFSKHLELEEVLLTDLLQWLSSTSSASPQLVDIMVKLMRKTGMRVDKQRWQKHLAKVAAKHDILLAADLQGLGFHNLQTSKKLLVLKILCEMQFDENMKFKNAINAEDSEEQRLKPVGRDEDGLLYWHQEDADMNIRLYVEDEEEDEDCGWKVICRNPDDIANLITQLKDEPAQKKPADDSEEDEVENKFQKFLKNQCTTDAEDVKMKEGDKIKVADFDLVSQENKKQNMLKEDEPGTKIANIKTEHMDEKSKPSDGDSKPGVKMEPMELQNPDSTGDVEGGVRETSKEELKEKEEMKTNQEVQEQVSVPLEVASDVKIESIKTFGLMEVDNREATEKSFKKNESKEKDLTVVADCCKGIKNQVQDSTTTGAASNSDAPATDETEPAPRSEPDSVRPPVPTSYESKCSDKDAFGAGDSKAATKSESDETQFSGTNLSEKVVSSNIQVDNTQIDPTSNIETKTVQGEPVAVKMHESRTTESSHFEGQETKAENASQKAGIRGHGNEATVMIEKDTSHGQISHVAVSPGDSDPSPKSPVDVKTVQSDESTFEGTSGTGVVQKPEREVVCPTVDEKQVSNLTGKGLTSDPVREPNDSRNIKPEKKEKTENATETESVVRVNEATGDCTKVKGEIDAKGDGTKILPKKSEIVVGDTSEVSKSSECERPTLDAGDCIKVKDEIDAESDGAKILPKKPEVVGMDTSEVSKSSDCEMPNLDASDYTKVKDEIDAKRDDAKIFPKKTEVVVMDTSEVTKSSDCEMPTSDAGDYTKAKGEFDAKRDDAKMLPKKPEVVVTDTSEASKSSECEMPTSDASDYTKAKGEIDAKRDDAKMVPKKPEVVVTDTSEVMKSSECEMPTSDAESTMTTTDIVRQTEKPSRQYETGKIEGQKPTFQEVSMTESSHKHQYDTDMSVKETISRHDPRVAQQTSDDCKDIGKTVVITTVNATQLSEMTAQKSMPSESRTVIQNPDMVEQTGLQSVDKRTVTSLDSNIPGDLASFESSQPSVDTSLGSNGSNDSNLVHTVSVIRSTHSNDVASIAKTIEPVSAASSSIENVCLVVSSEIGKGRQEVGEQTVSPGVGGSASPCQEDSATGKGTDVKMNVKRNENLSAGDNVTPSQDSKSDPQSIAVLSKGHVPKDHSIHSILGSSKPVESSVRLTELHQNSKSHSMEIQGKGIREISEPLKCEEASQSPSRAGEMTTGGLDSMLESPSQICEVSETPKCEVASQLPSRAGETMMGGLDPTSETPPGKGEIQTEGIDPGPVPAKDNGFGKTAVGTSPVEGVTEVKNLVEKAEDQVPIVDSVSGSGSGTVDVSDTVSLHDPTQELNESTETAVSNELLETVKSERQPGNSANSEKVVHCPEQKSDAIPLTIDNDQVSDTPGKNVSLEVEKSTEQGDHVHGDLKAVDNELCTTNEKSTSSTDITAEMRLKPKEKVETQGLEENMEADEKKDQEDIVVNGTDEEKQTDGEKGKTEEEDKENNAEVEKVTPARKGRRKKRRGYFNKRKRPVSKPNEGTTTPRKTPQKKKKRSQLDQLRADAELIFSEKSEKEEVKRVGDGGNDAYRTRSGRRVRSAKKDQPTMWQGMDEDEKEARKKKKKGLEEDEDFQYVETKQRGNASDSVRETVLKEVKKRIVEDDTPCMKCGLYSHPETILLCDGCNKGHHMACLTPPLMIIPDGDWYCPKCSQEKLIGRLQDIHDELGSRMKLQERKTRQNEYKKLLNEYTGISATNIIEQQPKPMKPKPALKKRRPSFTSSESELDDIVEDSYSSPSSPEIKTRRCRAKVSYDFSSYDKTIMDAIKSDIDAKSAEGEERPISGKDIRTIIAAEKGEDAELIEEEHKVSGKRKRRKLSNLNTSGSEAADTDSNYSVSSNDDEISEEEFQESGTSESDSLNEGKFGRRRNGRGRKRPFVKPTKRSRRLRKKRIQTDFETWFSDTSSEYEEQASKKKPKRKRNGFGRDSSDDTDEYVPSRPVREKNFIDDDDSDEKPTKRKRRAVVDSSSEEDTKPRGQNAERHRNSSEDSNKWSSLSSGAGSSDHDSLSDHGSTPGKKEAEQPATNSMSGTT